MPIQEHELQIIPAITGEVVGEYVELVEPDSLDLFRRASEILKTNTVLLEFLSDPALCKNVTNRERGIIGKQLERMYSLTDDLSDAIEELEELESDT